MVLVAWARDLPEQHKGRIPEFIRWHTAVLTQPEQLDLKSVAFLSAKGTKDGHCLLRLRAAEGAEVAWQQLAELITELCQPYGGALKHSAAPPGPQVRKLGKPDAGDAMDD
eukprot:4160627-Amphidinium_carterae.1